MFPTWQMGLVAENFWKPRFSDALATSLVAWAMELLDVKVLQCTIVMLHAVPVINFSLKVAASFEFGV